MDTIEYLSDAEYGRTVRQAVQEAEDDLRWSAQKLEELFANGEPQLLSAEATRAWMDSILSSTNNVADR